MGRKVRGEVFSLRKDKILHIIFFLLFAALILFSFSGCAEFFEDYSYSPIGAFSGAS